MRSTFVALVLFLAGCNSHSADGSLPRGSLDDAVVAAARLEPISISNEDNGWRIANDAARYPNRAVFTPANLQIATARDIDPSRAAELIKDFGPVDAKLDRLCAAAHKPSWLLDQESEGDGDGNHTGDVKVLVKGLIARARARMETGLVEGAVRDHLASRDVALGIIGGRASISQALVGITCLSLSNRALAHEAYDPKTPTSALREILAAIPTPPEQDVAMQNAIREELADQVLRNIELMPDPTLNPDHIQSFNSVGDQILPLVRGMPNAFDRRATATLISSGCAILIDNLTKPWAKQASVGDYVREQLACLPPSLMEGSHYASTPQEIEAAKVALRKVANPVGRLVLLLVIPTFDQFADDSFRWRADQEALRAVLAIRIWRDEHGGVMPASLDDLVSAKILARAPQDFYGTGALRYDAKRAVLWSVGPNGKDDGGKDRIGARTEVKDFVWSAQGL